MKRYCLACDLKEEADIISEDEAYHRQVWPAILQSIKDPGIEQMEIFRESNRLFIGLEADDGFSFEKKAMVCASNYKVTDW